MTYMKALFHKHHSGSLKLPKGFSNWMNIPKLKLTTAIIKRNSTIFSNTIPTTFTDGSKDNNKTACVAVLNKTILKKALLMESSIFTVEARAIDLALNIILKSKHKKSIIFSDSLSVLLSLRNKKFQNPLIIKLLSWLDSMSNRKEIIICWTLSHIGVRGNERADLTANQDSIYWPETNN